MFCELEGLIDLLVTEKAVMFATKTCIYVLLVEVLLSWLGPCCLCDSVVLSAFTPLAMKLFMSTSQLQICFGCSLDPRNSICLRLMTGNVSTVPWTTSW